MDELTPASVPVSLVNFLTSRNPGEKQGSHILPSRNLEAIGASVFLGQGEKLPASGCAALSSVDIIVKHSVTSLCVTRQPPSATILLEWQVPPLGGQTSFGFPGPTSAAPQPSVHLVPTLAWPLSPATLSSSIHLGSSPRQRYFLRDAIHPWQSVSLLERENPTSSIT